jgi:predicted component of type VI protein secretion system
MLVKLTISNKRNPEFHSEYLFDKTRITIGRLDENDVPLPDPELTVGRYHAEIQVEGDFAYIYDENSKNYTFLNGKQLGHAKQYQLRDHDHIQIGHYLIHYAVFGANQMVVEREESNKLGSTAVQASYQNPFEDYVKIMANAMQQLKATYQVTSHQWRDEALEQALLKGISGFKEDEVGKAVGDILGKKVIQQIFNPISQPAAPAPASAQGFVPFSSPDLMNQGEWERTVGSAYDTNRDAFFLKRMATVDDVLLRAIDKILKLPAHFKMEFLGHSMMPTGTAFPFDRATPEQLKAFLYDIAISHDELRGRLMAFENAIDGVLVHELAILDGYRNAVVQGSQTILDQLNPEQIKQMAEKEGDDMRIMGVFSHSKWVASVKKAHYELVREDKGVLEKTVFRAPFVKGYLARVEAGKGIR